ncbi:MAG: hypothetical protein ACJA0M_000246 [Chitinophagales bacterium]|jgi:hypothetical protein
MVELTQERFLAEVGERLERIFEFYADGEDVAVGERLRLEGFIQAGLVFGVVALDQVLVVLDTVHQRIFDEPFGEVFPLYDGADCIVAIPSKMQRAPVFPSTKD